MHSSNPGISQQSLISSLDDNNTNITTSDTNNNVERLKQHCNGNICNNNFLISISTQTNHEQLNTQIFTNSQKEI
ncbi:unnamed protein product, partial [Rotaria sp. Silwood2]